MAKRVLWTTQVRAMLGLELRKTFLRARALPIVVVALLPVLILGLRAAFFPVTGEMSSPAPEVARVYGQIFQIFFLRLVVFFGCFGIFTYLVRGETSERSLHFYLLAPMRREVYLAGKFLAGLVAAGTLFSISLSLQLVLAFVPRVTQNGSAYLFAGPGAGHALAYFGVTGLAIIGYGAVFTALALFFRNPMIPAAVLLGLEWLNFLLPPVLQRISVIHYLQSLCPVPFDRGPFALPAAPTPPALAVPGVLLLAGLLLWAGARRARRLEVTYAGD